MEKVNSFIEKILSYKTWSKKRKLDALLEFDCNMYTELGLESLKSEISLTKRKSRAIYKAIKEIDPVWGKELLWHMD